MTQDYPSNKEKCNRNEAKDKITKVQTISPVDVSYNKSFNEWSFINSLDTQ